MLHPFIEIPPIIFQGNPVCFDFEIELSDFMDRDISLVNAELKLWLKTPNQTINLGDFYRSKGDFQILSEYNYLIRAKIQIPGSFFSNIVLVNNFQEIEYGLTVYPVLRYPQSYFGKFFLSGTISDNPP